MLSTVAAGTQRDQIGREFILERAVVPVMDVQPFLTAAAGASVALQFGDLHASFLPLRRAAVHGVGISTVVVAGPVAAEGGVRPQRELHISACAPGTAVRLRRPNTGMRDRGPSRRRWARGDEYGATGISEEDRPLSVATLAHGVPATSHSVADCEPSFCTGGIPGPCICLAVSAWSYPRCEYGHVDRLALACVPASLPKSITRCPAIWNRLRWGTNSDGSS